MKFRLIDLLESVTSDFKKKWGEDLYKQYAEIVLKNKSKYTAQEADPSYWLGKDRTEKELLAVINKYNTEEEKFEKIFGKELTQRFKNEVINNTKEYVHDIYDDKTGEMMDYYGYWYDPFNKKTPKDLENFLNELRDSYYPKEYAERGYKEIYKSSNYIIYKVDTFAASFYLGKATGWCTSGRYKTQGLDCLTAIHPWEPTNRAHWNNYLSQGGQFYFIFHLKDPKVTMKYKTDDGREFTETDYHKYAMIVDHKEATSITDSITDQDVDIQNYYNHNVEVVKALIDKNVLDKKQIMADYKNSPIYVALISDELKDHINSKDLEITNISVLPVKIWKAVKDNFKLYQDRFWLKNKSSIDTHAAIYQNKFYDMVEDSADLPIIACVQINNEFEKDKLYLLDNEYPCQYIDFDYNGYLIVDILASGSYNVEESPKTSASNKERTTVYKELKAFSNKVKNNGNVIVEDMKNIPKELQKLLNYGQYDYYRKQNFLKAGIDLANDKFIPVELPKTYQETLKLFKDLSANYNPDDKVYCYGDSDNDIQIIDNHYWIKNFEERDYNKITFFGYFIPSHNNQEKKKDRQKNKDVVDKLKAKKNMRDYMDWSYIGNITIKRPVENKDLIYDKSGEKRINNTAELRYKLLTNKKVNAKEELLKFQENDLKAAEKIKNRIKELGFDKAAENAESKLKVIKSEYIFMIEQLPDDLSKADSAKRNIIIDTLKSIDREKTELKNLLQRAEDRYKHNHFTVKDEIEKIKRQIESMDKKYLEVVGTPQQQNNPDYVNPLDDNDERTYRQAKDIAKDIISKLEKDYPDRLFTVDDPLRDDIKELEELIGKVEMSCDSWLNDELPF